ncbi:hypothetical protein SASPL_130914 [Salvia splendens]|uniref:Uncharacterized protein n=1 Tax=Salvia splendens TaxID=180675 RepID=A0A8X8X855_SALSN|nr:hypothetical protein SASPL_130914 [Salvia splendens]
MLGEKVVSLSHNRYIECSMSSPVMKKKTTPGLRSFESQSGTYSLVSDNELSHTHSSKYASITNEMRFQLFFENEMVEEHSDNLGSSFLMDSRLEIEVDAVGDHGASNLDVAGVTNQSITFLCDNHGVEEDRDASPEGARVSSLEDIYLLCSSDETNIISPTPLPAVAFLPIEADFRFLLKENAYDEGGVCLRICNPVVQ